MATKKVNHNKIETCKLSKKPIDTNKDNYSVVIECQGDTIRSVGFYKSELLKELFTGQLKKIKEEMINRHKKMAAGMISQLRSVMPTQ